MAGDSTPARPSPSEVAAHPFSADGDPGLLSVVIVTYNCRREVEACLTSLSHARDELALEVVVIDNASSDGTVEQVRARFPWTNVLVNETNRGFAAAVNRAYRVTRGEFVLFLNPDTVVPRGTLATIIVALRERPDVGMLGCKLVRPDGSLDHACKRGFPTVRSALYHSLGLSRLRPRSPRFAHYTAGHLDPDETGLVDAINGAFMLVRREALAAVGPMDERFWLYGEDLDWCTRFWQAGWAVLYWPRRSIVHVKGASAGEPRPVRLNVAFHRSLWMFYRKHIGNEHSRPARMAVYGGIWARCGLSILLSPLLAAIRKVPARRPHPP